MSSLLPFLLLSGIVVLSIAAIKVERLRRIVKERDPDLFSRLGSPTGSSPPDATYGTREFQRFLYGRQFRVSTDPVIRRSGQSCYRWALAGAMFLAFFALLLAVTEALR